MSTAGEALSQGFRHHQAGQLAEAEVLYRTVLADQPENADALHLLGVVALETGRLDMAVEHLTHAIRISPAQAAFHVNLGETYRRMGDPEQAISYNQRAVELQPDLATGHANLGQLHQQQGDLAAAVECFRTAVRLSPQDATGHTLLGNALLQQDNVQEAEAEFRRAVELAPQSATAHYNLGAVLQSSKRYEQAAAAYRKAIELRPNHAEAHNNLGAVLQCLNMPADAELHYRRAVAVDPNLASAYNNLATLLIEENRFEEAHPFLQRAVELLPDSALAHARLGSVLQRGGHLDDAIVAIERAIELNPKAALPYNNLAICAQMQGRLDEAIELYHEALELNPESARNHSNYVYVLNYHPGYDARTIFEEHCRWGRLHADAITEASAGHTNDRTPGRRLRIGYVSSHFRNHAVNYFVEPILASHDHSQFEIFCYSSVAKEDDITERLRSYSDQWRDCLQQTDQQVAHRVREDQIDILIDLAGHIGGNRLLVFAHKPAPVQVTYIGYQNTTGMQAMDYRLTDAHADPPGTTDDFYTEKLVRLPRSFFCYRPSWYLPWDAAPPVALPPAIRNGYVTFGSFNNFAKVTPKVLATWARLLLAVPKSRLALLASVTDSLRQYVASTMAQHGVDPKRVELCRYRPRQEYLKLLAHIDIALDPFPFNGHTTTCDALWQGLPVVTLAGDNYASRFGSSAHVNLGLEDLIATSPDEYIEIAARLAGDLPRLKHLRAGMRERMQNSPLLDFAGFTRNLEAAYRKMWTDYCDASTTSTAPVASSAQAGDTTEGQLSQRVPPETDEQNADALYASGASALKAGEPKRAIELIGQAVRRDDSHAQWHFTLAEAHRQMGDLAQAVTCSRKAIELQPQLAAAHASLGAIYYQQGDLSAAAESFHEAARIDPQSAWAHVGYGQILLDQDLPAEAELSFRRGVQVAPDDRNAQEGLAVALVRQGKNEEARAVFEAVLRIAPDDASAHTNVGNILKELGLLDEAETHHRQAVALDPTSSLVLNNLGATLAARGRRGEAIDYLEEAARRNPASDQPLRNLAQTLFDSGRIEEAVAAARRTIELSPGDVVARSVLAVGLRSLGQIDEAIAIHRQAIEAAPDDPAEHSNLLYTLCFHPTCDESEVAAEHREWGRRHADPITARSKPLAHEPSSGRRLRIGYVSAYFREHAVNFFIEPILASHDGAGFEVFCYTNSHQADRATDRLKPYAEHWRDITREPDDAVSRLVREDKIDVLVDLSGHIPGNRLMLFARRPAPVQVTYIGYQHTTGMAAMDYRLTDDWADPPGKTDEFYTEKLVRLPRSFFAYRPCDGAPAVNRLPALENGYITFGSFNYFAKITPDVLATWARLLRAVPRSRLIVLPHTTRSLQGYLAEVFSAHGIDADRWSLVDRLPLTRYLELVSQVDVALDPFPFNGHTTTCDALWQGVPVVTLAGESYRSRFGSTAHVNLGLQELIAGSGNEYIEIATRLVGDVERLAELRAGMRERMQASPILDFAGFTRNLEAAFRQMWEDWCSQRSN